jgi:hypothetical protein
MGSSRIEWVQSFTVKTPHQRPHCAVQEAEAVPECKIDKLTDFLCWLIRGKLTNALRRGRFHDHYSQLYTINKIASLFTPGRGGGALAQIGVSEIEKSILSIVPW